MDALAVLVLFTNAVSNRRETQALQYTSELADSAHNRAEST